MRVSFRAKILLALVGTVVLLVGTSLLAIRNQVRTQVDVLVDETVSRAARVFSELELLRAQELERLGLRFTRSVRVRAGMETALADDDPEYLAGQVDFELGLAGYPPGLLVFRDIDGVPLVRILDGSIHLTELGAVDPTEADDCAYEAPSTRYLLHDGLLFTVQRCLITFFDEPLGTVTLGFPLDDEVARQLGEVAGAEVCVRVEGRCVAGTAGLNDSAANERMGIPDGEEIQIGGVRHAVVSRPLADAPSGAALVLAVPLEGILGPFDRIRRAERIAGGVALFVALLLGILLSRGLAEPVRTLVRATDRVRKGEYDFTVEVKSRDEMGDLADAFNGMLADLALKERYRGVLDKVVSKDVAEEMLKGEIRLGGETRRVTTLFADLRGFTSLTEGLESQEVIGMLNEWFDRAAEAVEGEGGVVDKFLGDGLMAIFGAPIPQDDHALRAIQAAVAMRDGTAELNAERRARGEAPIEVGIGLATGDVVAGNSGSRNRLNYTVLGETVNLAARLCGEAGGGEVLASEETFQAARASDPAIPAEETSPRRLKGLSYEVRPWRVLGGALSTAVGIAIVGCTAALLTFTTPDGASGQGIRIDPPTLADLDIGYISPSGFLQIHPSGRFELEFFAPGDEEPWLIAETDPFLAGRMRLFVDTFVGDRIFGSVELRADRGEAPGASDLEARIQQAFLRVALARSFDLHIQAGKFITPFGSYPSRARSSTDPFLRPPLHYDYRTMACAGIAPGNVNGFLTWKDRPDEFRAKGAPVIWDTPYPTGILLGGSTPLGSGAAHLTAQVAMVNSAPSAEPWLWDPDFSRNQTPSWIANVGVQLRPELHLGLSYNRGSWLKPAVEGLDPGSPGTPAPGSGSRAGWEIGDYEQELLAVDGTLTRGMFLMRGEVVFDRWEVPNVVQDVKDLSWAVEGRLRTQGGAWLGLRYGQIHFNELTDSEGRSEAWDYNVSRLQVAAGYRISRNLDVRAEAMFNRIAEGPREGGSLLSARLGWTF